MRTLVAISLYNYRTPNRAYVIVFSLLNIWFFTELSNGIYYVLQCFITCNILFNIAQYISCPRIKTQNIGSLIAYGKASIVKENLAVPFS